MIIRSELFPPAIITEAPTARIETASIKVSQQEIDLDQRLRKNALTRAPNIKKPGGRVNCEGLMGPGVVAISVSPLNPKFRTQIDDGVWPFVERLLQLNYMTISSCQGHADHGGGDHFCFVIVTPDFEQAKKLKQVFEQARYCSVEIKRSMANVEISYKNNTTYSFSAEKPKPTDTPTDKNLYEEYRDINYMYLRNYPEYWYVDVAILRDKDYYSWTVSNFLGNLIHRLKLEYSKRQLKRILFSSDFEGSPY